jgi:transposase-like protein
VYPVFAGKTEGAKFWLKLVNELKTRGLEDILVACCDGLKGFPEAIETAFPKTTVQTCIVHMIRNSLRYVVCVRRSRAWPVESRDRVEIVGG